MILVDDKQIARASADCIALKCEEKGCQFITAWDSEMQRHLAECHAPPRSRKPLPMLIPLSPTNARSNSTLNSGPPTTLLKVPRVRVRPELAQIARDTELAKMCGNKEVGMTRFFSLSSRERERDNVRRVVIVFPGDKFEERFQYRSRYFREKERLLLR